MDNFFGQPVGRAVLFLNDFHFGANLNKLNRAARLVPKDVKGFSTLSSGQQYSDPGHGQEVINLLDDDANDAENNLSFKLDKK